MNYSQYSGKQIGMELKQYIVAGTFNDTTVYTILYEVTHHYNCYDI